MERLNRWFALSSVLMTASLFWLIWVDYDRPWRAFQKQHAVDQAALAHLDYLEAITQERTQELDRARQRLRDAEDMVGKVHGVERGRLEEDLVEAELMFRKTEGPWSRLKQLLDVTRDTYEKSREQHGSEHPHTAEVWERMQEEERQLSERLAQKEKWGDRVAEIRRRIRDIENPVKIARKRLTDLEHIAASAAKKDRQYRGVLKEDGLLGGVPLVGALINAPLLDFMAPKNTPALEQVNQLVLPNVRQRLNYLESYTTDRCTTCHVAIADPKFSQKALARRLERSLPAVNEALQRAGLQPVAFPDPVELEDGTILPVGDVARHWDRLPRETRYAYFEALLERVNSYLEDSGRKRIRLEQPLLAHPDLDLFINVNSPHPMSRMGCTVCHEGNPQETDFVQAAHTPPTHAIEKKWEHEYYIHMLGVPNITFETVQHYWDRPMLLPEYTEAGCAKCHSKVTDIALYNGERKGRHINYGQHLFREMGCINCHHDDAMVGSRKVGPDLTHIASKLTPGFVQQWAFSPKAFRPSTLMPHFFQQENNRPESANRFDTRPELRTTTEVVAITQYLFAVSTPWEPVPKPTGIDGDAERGRELVQSLGCLACHANMAESGEQWIAEDLVHRAGLSEERAMHRVKGMAYDERVGYAMEHFTGSRMTFLAPQKVRAQRRGGYSPPVFSRFAPELSGTGSKVTFQWLYSWLMDPTRYAPDTKMPSLRLTPGEAADIAAYLLTLRSPDFDQDGFELTTERRSMLDELLFTLLTSQKSQRRSRAIMRDAGGELTEILVSSLEGSPSFDRREAYDLISPMALEDKKLMYLGSKMVLHYGCYACHNIAGFEATTPPGTDLTLWAEKPASQLDFAFYDHAFDHIREEKESVFDPIYPQSAANLLRWSPLPDDAREEISLTHAAFAKHKLLNPRIWDRQKLKKPYEKLKMPNFYFTEEEAAALTTYLLSRMPARVDDLLRVDYETSLDGPIAEGRRLVRELNCIGCHEIEDNIPPIQQYYQRTIGGEMQLDASNAPPTLIGEGAKVQHPWLHRFLQQVEPLRPWLRVRMPSFHLTGDQATTLVQYFAAIAKQESNDLGERLFKIEEYIDRAQQKAATAGSDSTESEPSPGDDWFQQEDLTTQAESLRRWGVQRRLIRKPDPNPLAVEPKRLRAAHAGLLDRARFLHDLYDVEYPFVEPAGPLSPAERFDVGMSFLNAMGCLKCHVLGDMLPGPAANTTEFVDMYRLDGVRGSGDDATVFLNGEPYPVGARIDGHTIISAENVYSDTGDVETSAIVEGPGPGGQTERIMLLAASAPNLALTYERLRREWVYNWMLEPQWIQPGTKMPQNFAGGVSPFEGDPDYPGTSMDHINLLVDTLFDAGRRRARAPLPKLFAAEEEEFDEEGGAFDDEFDD